ncbi:endonuclease III domain-containing protein [Acidithiobacillus sp.]|jgi:endonuclease-3 related protein|uniref:endonuclease III domain-containing protein n=1 Tax=Acidithiobacillus sp. TaxID=1872118 RepID=UPI002634908C|nr:endonuclease [Acidithiobacillus sp.]
MPDQRGWSAVFGILEEAFGPQDWWPAQSPFEVMVGAILTQNTAWRNVEKAIANLRAVDALSVRALLALPEGDLAELLRPSGFYRIKTRRLLALCRFLETRGVGAVPEQLARQATVPALRKDLLAVHGIGAETADSILLYALGLPVMVVDAYTRRIGGRLGLLEDHLSYGEVQAGMEAELKPDDVLTRNALHALLVSLGKDYCRPRPRCGVCPLHAGCAYAAGS